jgi:hypothetical protein
VSPPSSPSPGFAANGAAARRQPDPPSGGSGDASAAVDPPISRSQSRGNTARGENVSSGSTSAPAPPSISSALSSIGGEPLAGSGFETQPAQRAFAQASVSTHDGAVTSGGRPSSSSIASSTARSETSADAVADGPVEGVAPSNSTSPGGSGAVSEVASVGSAGSANQQPPAPAKRRGPLTRAVDRYWALRRRVALLPSDAAPHSTPPRIPIDHEE